MFFTGLQVGIGQVRTETLVLCMMSISPRLKDLSIFPDNDKMDFYLYVDFIRLQRRTWSHQMQILYLVQGGIGLKFDHFSFMYCWMYVSVMKLSIIHIFIMIWCMYP